MANRLAASRTAVVAVVRALFLFGVLSNVFSSVGAQVILPAEANTASVSVPTLDQQRRFAQVLHSVDQRLDRGAIVYRFFELLQSYELGAFQALQQRIAGAEQPLQHLAELGADSDAVAGLLSLVQAYAGYQVGSAGNVPLDAKLDHRAMSDSLARLHAQSVQHLQHNEVRWQRTYAQITALVVIAMLLVVALAVLGYMLLRRRRELMFAQQALEREGERRAELMAAIPGAVLICDEQGRVVSASESASQLLGYRHKALLQRPMQQLVAPQFAHQYELICDGAQRNNGFKGHELMMLSHSGSEVAVEIYSGCYEDPDAGRRLILLVRDVGDQYLMYEQSQHCQQRFDLAVMASRDGIWDWDMVSGDLYLSPAWLKIVGLGKTPERDGLRALLSCVPEEEQSELRPLLVKFLKSDEQLFNCEHHLRNREGLLIDVSLQAAAQRDASGRVTRLVGVHCDISVAKQMERQLLADKQALEDRLRLQSMQLAEVRQQAEQAGAVKSVFLSVIGHEFRTPMNAVVGMSDLLAKSALSREQRLMLDTIQRSSQSLLTTLDNIIDYSLLESGDVQLQEELIQLWEFIEGVSLVMAPVVARNQQQFLLRIDPRLPSQLRADPIRLRQLLLVLLENAVKFSVYSVPQGIIELLVRPASDAEQRHYQWAQLVLEVHDNGVGISEPDSQNLFRPFVQAESSTSRRFGGVGLGLAVAEKLVALMKGHILLSSDGDSGSCFSVLLPSEGLELNTADKQADEDIESLAIVGDDGLRLSLSAAMSRRGWRVRFFSAAEEVQQYLSSASPSVTRLLITDSYSPWLEEYRRAGGELIILQPRPVAEEKLRAEADTVYTNPMLPSRLYKAIEHCLARVKTAGGS